ncbi:Rpn family recombination-promoting nuclease/putative transposase [Candidatus Kuenenia stuttgartensis]|uniref:Rpn family recombination-promoting nuclease/putative transposase n=1 Tax=Kuenenia stuttgartiensis TaxID=174633 RepID=UPI00146A717A|nr:Rpn family recombination-promoting nuclease/putative transposase [Candidatus Kuenenia stuttgartiensis]
MEILNPHDKFFKETFSIRENAIDFLSGRFPPEILKKLDLSTLTQDNSSYIDEELKEHFSDIVYTCFCKDKEIRITLLFEHKSYAVAWSISSVDEIPFKDMGKQTASRHKGSYR